MSDNRFDFGKYTSTSQSYANPGSENDIWASKHDQIVKSASRFEGMIRDAQVGDKIVSRLQEDNTVLRSTVFALRNEKEKLTEDKEKLSKENLRLRNEVNMLRALHQRHWLNIPWLNRALPEVYNSPSQTSDSGESDTSTLTMVSNSQIELMRTLAEQPTGDTNASLRLWAFVTHMANALGLMSARVIAYLPYLSLGLRGDSYTEDQQTEIEGFSIYEFENSRFTNSNEGDEDGHQV